MCVRGKLFFWGGGGGTDGLKAYLQTWHGRPGPVEEQGCMSGLRVPLADVWLPACGGGAQVRHILLGERTALNIVTRASGVATQASRMATAAIAYWLEC